MTDECQNFLVDRGKNSMVLGSPDGLIGWRSPEYPRVGLYLHCDMEILPCCVTYCAAKPMVPADYTSNRINTNLQISFKRQLAIVMTRVNDPKVPGSMKVGYPCARSYKTTWLSAMDRPG